MLTKQIFFVFLLQIVRYCTWYVCNYGTILPGTLPYVEAALWIGTVSMPIRSRLSVSMLIQIGMFLNPNGVTGTCFFSYPPSALYWGTGSYWISAFITYTGSPFPYRNCWTRWRRRERWSARLVERPSQAEK
jgi:hypothetical protein